MEIIETVQRTNVVGPATIVGVFHPLLLTSFNSYLIFVLSGADSFEVAVERLKGTRDELPELENEGMYQGLEVTLSVMAEK